MSLMDEAKTVIEVLRKVGAMDEVQRVIDLQQALLDLQEDLRLARLERDEFRKQLEERGRLIRGAEGFFYADGDPDRHCPHCWESHAKAVHLTSSSGGSHWQCSRCKGSWAKDGTIARHPMVLPG